jgi:uncharacterized protein YceH (UPF0502 family)
MHSLTKAEGRVLGVLIEKESIRPDIYPLSLTHVWAGCNQKTNRRERMVLPKADVLEALEGLYTKELAPSTKARHVLRWSHNLKGPAQVVRLVGALLLNGPSTTSELRAVVSRMTRFSSNDDIVSLLKTVPYVRLRGRRWFQSLTEEEPIPFDQEIAELRAKLDWIETNLYREHATRILSSPV